MNRRRGLRGTRARASARSIAPSCRSLSVRSRRRRHRRSPRSPWAVRPSPGARSPTTTSQRHRILVQYHGSGRGRHGFGLHGRRHHAHRHGNGCHGGHDHHGDHRTARPRSPTAATRSPSSRRRPKRRSMPILPSIRRALRPGSPVLDSGQLGQQPGFGGHAADDRPGGRCAARQQRPGRSALYVCRADQRPQRRHGDRHVPGHRARGHAVQRRQHLHLDADAAPS